LESPIFKRKGLLAGEGAGEMKDRHSTSIPKGLGKRTKRFLLIPRGAPIRITKGGYWKLVASPGKREGVKSYFTKKKGNIL